MKTKLIILIIALSSSFAFSQKKVADKFFENFAFIKASELYEDAYNDGDDSEHVLTRLGDCYYNNSESEKAVQWYGKAIEKYKNINPEYIFKYIQSLKSVGNYEEANTWLKTFKEIQNDDRRVKDLDLTSLEKYNELTSTEGVYVETTNLPLNTQYSDFGGYVQGDQFIFASTRNGSKKVYKWNDEPFLDIYQASISTTENGPEIDNILPLESDDINTDFHEATVAITNDGKTIYFTRDNVNKRKKLSYDRKGTSHLKIYKAELIDGTWQNIVELPFNDAVSSTGHPALSPDNNTLYFVSDREGGYGQTDIYKVNISTDGIYGNPENLGANINTEGREMFPFVDKDNMFYFSSDGFINLGLLDIFKSDVLNNAEAEAENLGAPYNSGYDDFAYFLDTEKGTGFFSSNRPGGKGGDDVYSFGIYECKQTIKGIARDSESLEVLPTVNVELIDETGKAINTLSTNDKGEYIFKDIDCNKKYTIRGSKPDYKDDLAEVTTDDENGKENTADLSLIPLIKGNEIVINPIFFDFDKWNIRTDAAYELENIVAVMREHPKMVIKIESHTDSRGRDAYNMKLSDRRAKSTRDYLLSRNIGKERLESAIGYGETQLVNECANRVKCTEEQHQENRRSKFIIINDYN